MLRAFRCSLVAVAAFVELSSGQSALRGQDLRGPNPAAADSVAAARPDHAAYVPSALLPTQSLFEYEGGAAARFGAERVSRFSEFLAVRAGSFVSQRIDKAGGKNWEVVNSGVQDDLHSVAFAGDKVGVAVGANFTIIRTTDGGNTWARVMGPKEQRRGNFASVLFASDKVGWVRNDFTCDVYRTADAGASWNRVKTYDEGSVYAPSGLANHAVFDQLYFWQNSLSAVGGNSIFVTSGGDGKWTRLWESEGSLGGKGVSLVFTSPKVGWMGSVSNSAPVSFYVGRTTDGGKTWSKHRFDKDKVSGNHMFVHAVGDQVWTASQLGGYVFTSTDGGKSWTPYGIGTSADAHVLDLRFLDAKTGFVLCHGESSQVRRTTDGGKTWHELGRLQKGAKLYGMHFTPNGSVFVVGKGGYVARYPAD